VDKDNTGSFIFKPKAGMNGVSVKRCAGHELNGGAITHPVPQDHRQINPPFFDDVVS